MNKTILTGLALCLILTDCNNDITENSTKVLVKIQSAYHQKIYFIREPFNDEQVLKLDSAVMQTGLDSFTFYIPGGTQQRLYALTVAESNIKIPIVNDANEISVYYNYATHRYSYKNSPASQQLKDLTDQQLILAKTMRKLKFVVDSLTAHHASPKIIKDSTAKLGTVSNQFFNNYRTFADTVHSPAAFLAVYDAVELGNDHAKIKSFITAAAARFTSDTTIQSLKKNVLDYFAVFDNPYKPGDMLPELVLPDEYGIPFSTYSLKGKYVLVNVWSTFCDECMQYAEAARKAKQQLPAGKFEAVSVAVDDQKQAWLNIIAKQKYNWPQLIDAGMWNGTALKTLRFDSIPYNFLIGPDGRLIAKAIKADSVVTVIKNWVK